MKYIGRHRAGLPYVFERIGPTGIVRITVPDEVDFEHAKTYADMCGDPPVSTVETARRLLAMLPPPPPGQAYPKPAFSR